MSLPLPFNMQELLGIEEFLRSCCVPLVSDENGKLAVWGTGTFYRQGATLSLVTAAHIFDDVRPEHIAVADLGTGQYVTLGNCVVHYPRQDERKLDVAIIRLNDAEFVARRK